MKGLSLIEIPDLQVLLRRAEDTPNRNHVWGKPEIDFSSFKKVTRKSWFGRETFYTIRVKYTCEVCGSKKIGHMEYYNNDWRYPHSYNFNIYHSERYYSSSCRQKYLEEKQVKREAPFKCPYCGHVIPKHLANDHVKKHEKVLAKIKAAEERDKKISENLRIIKEAENNESQIRLKRVKYAVYRLYRQLNLSPKQIVEKTGIKEERVRCYISQVFKQQCLKDDFCIFKKFLSEGKSV